VTLTLRVAARYATRPIPLDKGEIRQLAEELGKKVEDHCRRQPQDMQLGHDSQVLAWSWKIKSVRGDDMRIDGAFSSEPSQSDQLITGAYIRRADLLEDGDLHLVIRLNGSKTYGDYVDTHTLSNLIFNDLIHELTHAAEWWYHSHKDLVQESAVLSDPESADRYYNSPHEVRAYMQQIVDNLRNIAPGYRKRVMPHASPQEFVNKVLDMLPKWRQIRDHLTPQNKALILKAVYRALDEDGLV
jgi:hypothetical protein